MIATGTTNNEASGGISARLAEPAFPAKCGINVAILHDLSNSLSAGDLTAMKAASSGFVDALVGTPSQVSTFTFASGTRRRRGECHPSVDVGVDGRRSHHIKNRINGMVLPGERSRQGRARQPAQDRGSCRVVGHVERLPHRPRSPELDQAGSGFTLVDEHGARRLRGHGLEHRRRGCGGDGGQLVRRGAGPGQVAGGPEDVDRGSEQGRALERVRTLLQRPPDRLGRGRRVPPVQRQQGQPRHRVEAVAGGLGVLVLGLVERADSRWSSACW